MYQILMVAKLFFFISFMNIWGEEKEACRSLPLLLCSGSSTENPENEMYCFFLLLLGWRFLILYSS